MTVFVSFVYAKIMVDHDAIIESCLRISMGWKKLYAPR